MLRSFFHCSALKMYMSVVIVCVLAGCGSEEQMDSQDNMHDSNIEWSCPEGEVSRSFLMAKLNPDYFNYGNEGPPALVFGSNEHSATGQYESYEGQCLDQAAIVVTIDRYLPTQHVKMTEYNAGLDRQQAEVEQLVVPIEQREDPVKRLFGLIRIVCDNRWEYQPHPYAYTGIIDSSPESVRHLVDFYKKSAEYTLSDNWVGRLGTNQALAVPARPDGRMHGKTGGISGIQERVRDSYLATWGDAYESYRANLTDEYLERVFPSRDFDRTIEKEC